MYYKQHFHIFAFKRQATSAYYDYDDDDDYYSHFRNTAQPAHKQRHSKSAALKRHGKTCEKCCRCVSAPLCCALQACVGGVCVWLATANLD